MSKEIETSESAQESDIAAKVHIFNFIFIGVGLSIAAALGYLLTGWLNGYALSSSLQYVFQESLRGTLTFTLIAAGGAYIKHLYDGSLEKQRHRQALLLEDQRQRQAMLDERERRCISVIEDFMEINSGFYKLRKRLESRLQPESEVDKLALRQEMVAESVDLEARYGTLKTRAIRHFELPPGDFGTKTKTSKRDKKTKAELLKELEDELKATGNQKVATRKRLDLLGEYYDDWRHTLGQRDLRKIPSNVRDRVWKHYEVLLEYFEETLLKYLEEGALERGDRTQVHENQK